MGKREENRARKTAEDAEAAAWYMAAPERTIEETADHFGLPYSRVSVAVRGMKDRNVHPARGPLLTPEERRENKKAYDRAWSARKAAQGSYEPPRALSRKPNGKHVFTPRPNRRIG